MQLENCVTAFLDFWHFLDARGCCILKYSIPLGLSLILFILLKLIYTCLIYFRLYFWYQYIYRVNLVNKYGEWVVITGATDGIGLEMAKELAKRGHSLIIVGRNEDKLARTKSILEARSSTGQVVPVKIDLADSSYEKYRCLEEQLNAISGGVAILINNAGVAVETYKRHADRDLDELMNMINVNAVAAITLSKIVLPMMVKRGRGLVVNVSSGLGYIPIPYSSVYSATKSFTNFFSRTLELEYLQLGIDVVNLTPGFVRTKMLIFESLLVRLTTARVDSYARSALNVVGANPSTCCGYFRHEIEVGFARLLEKFNLAAAFFRAIDKERYRNSKLNL